MIDLKITNPDRPEADARERSFRNVESQECGMFLSGVILAAADHKGRLIIEVDCRS